MWDCIVSNIIYNVIYKNESTEDRIFKGNLYPRIDY